MTKTKIEIELDIPEGYEYAGEYRRIARGELYLDNERNASVWEFSSWTASHYALLRKAEIWKQLTPEKAFEFMLSRKEVTLRHHCWKGTNRTHKNTLNRIFHNGHTLCVQLEVEAFISYVEYLEQDA